jgi:hypothetical protein
MGVDERDNASIRIAAGHEGKDGEQQHVRQFILDPAVGGLRR